jgi:subtilase family serine protease
MNVIRFIILSGVIFSGLIILPISAAGSSTPDLTIVGVSGPSALQQGKTVSVSVLVGNLGDSFLGNALVSVYLTRDSTLKNSDDILIGSFYTKDRIPKTSSSQALKFTLRKNVPKKPGTYHYGAIIDPNNQIAEKKESNNQYVNGGMVTIT